jgi:type I restriction enzyme R subunit
MASRTGQVTIGKLALFRIEQVEVALPPIQMQEVVVKKLAQIDRLRQLNDRHLKQLDDLFESLQASLFKSANDTGIDVPEIVNLVFFKIVRSKTKFWQMIGRGTRLCPDLFGPGQNKEFFYIFDFCQNFEFFNQNPDVADAPAGASLSKRLFAARVELIAVLDEEGQVAGPKGAAEAGRTFQHQSEETTPERQLRNSVAERLRDEVAGMSVDNFLVRPKRKAVERFVKPSAWEILGFDARQELVEEIAGLPTSLVDDDTDAKEFDLLMLRTELAALRVDQSLPRLRRAITEICSFLEGLSNIPAVAKELTLIQEMQTDAYWQDITAPILESARRRLRGLVKLIEWKKRGIIYSDFVDEIGTGIDVQLEGVNPGTDMTKFRLKARHFLQKHKDHLAIRKLRMNEALTPTDLAELERMFLQAGIGEQDALDRVKADGGLGVFVRSLVGLDREAAKKAFSYFLTDKNLGSDQIEFLNMIIDHLTERGTIEAASLYESPFTDVNPLGLGGVFGSEATAKIVSIVREISERAAA